jgi:transmembrane sensor
MDASDRRRRASEEAAAWWVRFRAGDIERAEREEFVDWLRESAMHVAEMLRIAKLTNALDEFQSWLKINTDGPDHDDGSIIELPLREAPVDPKPTAPRDRRSLPPKRPWAGLIAVGAGFLLLGAIGLFLSFRTEIIETNRGERREVALADGSVVEVDPETRLRVAFGERARRVLLERGRAFFKVAKNPARPFLVQADGTTVRAVGTAFGVERAKQGILVTVAEGKVGVFVSEISAPVLPALPITSQELPSHAPKEVLLTAGQQVRAPSTGSVGPIRKVDSERELAWAKGRLVFDDETVAEAVDEFNRYNRVQLRVANDALALRTVSAIFDASDPESFLAFLQTDGAVRITRSESEIVMQ